MAFPTYWNMTSWEVECAAHTHWKVREVLKQFVCHVCRHALSFRVIRLTAISYNTDYKFDPQLNQTCDTRDVEGALRTLLDNLLQAVMLVSLQRKNTPWTKTIVLVVAHGRYLT